MCSSPDQENHSGNSEDGNFSRGYSRLDIFLIFTCFLGTCIRAMPLVTIGSALPDILQITNSATSQASTVLLLWSLGLFTGTVTTNFFLKMDGTLLMALNFVLLGITTALIPLPSSIYLMAVIIAVHAFVAGILGVGILVIVVKVGARHRAQIVQAGYAFKFFGPFAGALIVRPFQSKEIGRTQSWNETSMSYLPNDNATSLCALNCSLSGSRHWSESHILYGYVILGCACFVPALCFFTIYFLKQSKDEDTVTVTSQAEESSQSNQVFRNKTNITMAVLVFFVSLCYNTSQKSFVDLFTTFCIESKADVTKSEAVLMLSVCYGAYTFGCINAIWISKLVDSFVIIVVNITALAVVFLVLCFAAERSTFLLWFSTISIGLCCSPVLASFVSFSLAYIADDSVMVNICVAGMIAGLMVFPPIIPLTFGTIGPMALMYFCFGGMFTAMLLLIPLYLLRKCSAQYKESVDEEMVTILDKSN